jgi:hypothetical protein
MSAVNWHGAPLRLAEVQISGPRLGLGVRHNENEPTAAPNCFGLASGSANEGDTSPLGCRVREPRYIDRAEAIGAAGHP